MPRSNPALKCSPVTLNIQTGLQSQLNLLASMAKLSPDHHHQKHTFTAMVNTAIHQWLETDGVTLANEITLGAPISHDEILSPAQVIEWPTKQ